MFKVEDLITKTILSDQQMRSSWIIQDAQGFYVYHKPSDTEVEVSHHENIHRNKAEAMIILKDLLTKDTLVAGDNGFSIYETEYNRKVLDNYDMSDAHSSEEDQAFVCRTPECARYLTRENIKKTLDELYEEKDNLTKQLKELY